MNSKRVLVGTWIATFIIIGWRSFHNQQGMPAPKTLFAANVTWSLLGFLSLASEELAGTLSVGILLALLVTNSSILGAAATSVASASSAPAGATLASSPTPYGAASAKLI